MSQRDVVAEIRAAQPEVPTELRERVRLIAAAAPPERRSPLTRRRIFAVLVPVAAAVAVAVAVTRPTHHSAAVEPLATDRAQSLTTQTAEGGVAHFKAATVPGVSSEGIKKVAPIAPSTTRPQKYSASLTLRVPGATAVSDATKRAVAIVTGLGGYVVSAHVNADHTFASSDLVLKVPKTNVRRAIARLSALGTITAEQVDIQDLQAGIATSDRTMERLQRQLAALRAETSTPAIVRQIAALTSRIERLQRAEAATLRAARYATVSLHLNTPAPATPKHHGHGPLHGLGVAFRWIGIGAVYGLALGVPALLLIGLVWLGVRTIRRRRENALLSRP